MDDLICECLKYEECDVMRMNSCEKLVTRLVLIYKRGESRPPKVTGQPQVVRRLSGDQWNETWWKVSPQLKSES